MNKSRRNTLKDIVKTMQSLKNMENNAHTLEVLEQAAEDLELVNDEEQDALDNMPDSLRWSARATSMNDNLDNLADALCSMGTVVEVYQDNDTAPYEKAKEDILSVIKNCTKAIVRV